MQGYSGVYALYNKNRLYYVGLATNLYARLIGHTRNKHAGRWDSFVIFRITRVTYLKDIETLLLRLANPPGNSVTGHFHRDADLTRILKTIHKEQMRRLQRMKKVLR